jgi:hypothetical protein
MADDSRFYLQLFLKQDTPMAVNPQEPVVAVPVATFQQMQNDLNTLKQVTAQREVETAAANAKAMVAEGRADTLARQHRQEVEAERNRAANFATQAELGRALASQPLAPGAAEQLTKLWSGNLTASPTDTGFAVRTTDYKDVPTFVSEQLSKPEWQHFRADRQPATPASAPNANSQPAAPPRTVGEYFAQEAQANLAAQAQLATQTNPANDMSKSFGLPNRNQTSPISRGAIPGLGRLLGR